VSVDSPFCHGEPCVAAGGAVFGGPDNRYRYSLDRFFPAEHAESVCFVMLNPSTADATTNDPTIRRCIGFARSWGFSKLQVVNLFAFRATDPRALRTARDPVGPENGFWIRQAIRRAHTTVCAWGAWPHLTPAHTTPVLDAPGVLWCLGRTKGGAPRHPLYVAADTTLVPWP
jgi:hypothetical protein